MGRALPSTHVPVFCLRSRRNGLKGLIGCAVLFSLAFCHRSADRSEPRDSPNPSGVMSAPIGLLRTGQALTRTDILLQIARLSHTELSSRLGAHRIESRTRYTITPVEQSPAKARPPELSPGFREGQPIHPFDGGAAWEDAVSTLSETRFIAVDSAGNVQLQNQNDHGYGVEAMLEKEFVYLRMRYAPYIRQRLEGDEAYRLRAIGYESGAALLDAVAPFVFLSAPVETTRLGRAAWQVTLSRQQKNGERQLSQDAGKTWRSAVAVDSLDGYAVVDRQRGTLLQLQLSVRFVTARGKAPPGTVAADNERIQVEAQHEMQVVALGTQIESIKPPGEWNEPPKRERPNQDKLELLNGLLPARP